MAMSSALRCQLITAAGVTGTTCTTGNCIHQGASAITVQANLPERRRPACPAKNHRVPSQMSFLEYIPAGHDATPEVARRLKVSVVGGGSRPGMFGSFGGAGRKARREADFLRKSLRSTKRENLSFWLQVRPTVPARKEFLERRKGRRTIIALFTCSEAISSFYSLYDLATLRPKTGAHLHFNDNARQIS